MIVGFVPPPVPTRRQPRRFRGAPSPAARSLRAAAAAAALTACVILAAAPAASGPHADVPAVVTADVSPGAQATMPEHLWRSLTMELLHARDVGGGEGSALPDAAQCRAAHALFAVLATFERAVRLPGLAQDPDRAYAVAHIVVRNCTTNGITTTTLRLESDPLSSLERTDPDARASRLWERALRAAFARNAVALSVPQPETPPPAAAAAPVLSRVVRVDDDGIVIAGGRWQVTQMLRDVADAAGHPHAPIPLVVTGVDGKYALASVLGGGSPKLGDRVEAAPPAAPPVTPSPAPRP